MGYHDSDVHDTPRVWSAQERHGLIAALASVLSADNLLHEAEDLRPFECDGLSAYRRLPLAVALPDSIEQVQAVMRLCHERRLPVIARGAGTGLSGGVLPREDAVVLSLAKFNRILHIDPVNRTARVQPGVRNLAVSEAAAAHGLYYAPDPSSQIACTIGGNVAENAGGVHCLKYGLTVHNLLRLVVITADGERVVVGSEALDSPGYDVLALMTGSEGMLGVIVEATLKLLPLPAQRRTVLAAFDDVSRAADAVASIIGAGIIPAGLEMMDRLAIQAAEAYVHAGYPAAQAILLCEVDGGEDDVLDQLGRVEAVLRDCGATELRVAADEAQRLTFWKGRKAAFPAVGRLAPDYYCMDGTIPRRRLAEVLARIAALSADYGLPVANVFHAGDGNLHPLILYDANRPGQLAQAEAMGGKILEACLDAGGTITGEHGVGVEKLDQMCLQFGAAELRQFHALKAAFDPHCLLNPGKAVPTLRRCAEGGAMHVHQGGTVFPELERF